jgi:two-component system sensor histidine kinase KdpD
MHSVRPPLRIGWRAAPSAAGVASSVALIAGATALGHALLRFLPASSVPLVFLVTVLISAATFGFWTGLLAAALAFLSANFFFVEPIHSFSVNQPADVLALAVFLGAAALTGLIAGRMREEADAARRRAELLELLSDFTADLSKATTLDETAAVLVRHLARAAGGPAAILDIEDGAVRGQHASPADLALDAADLQAAEWTARRGEPSPAAAPGWSGSSYTFRPLRRAGAVATVVGFVGAQAGREREQAVEAMLRQGAAAMERVTLAGEAEAARAAAQEEKLRSALLSSLSHDLRTPLAAILGSVTTLRELGEAMPAEARADLLVAIEEETGRLSRYVANLLAMTRLEAGVAVKRDWIDVADVLRAAAVRARAAFPGQALDLSLPPALPLVRADAALLEQALFNLIENATRHAPAGAPVILSAAADAETVAMAVEDSGPGVEPKLQERIFDKFFTTAPSGAGLGLAICRGVVEAFGGTIALEKPTATPGGARFVIRLPVTAMEREE